MIYSEVVGSTNCKQCESSNYSLLIFPIFFAIIVVSVLMALDAPSEDDKNVQIDYPKLLLKDDLGGIKLCVLRPILYFSQSLNFVTIQTGLSYYFQPLIKWLSLDVFDSTGGNDQGAGFCFVKDLTSLGLQFWYLFFPLMMFLVIGIFKGIDYGIKYKWQKEIKFLQHGANFVLSIFIMLVGNIISVMLKVMACSNINGKSVHFYDGSKSCFGGVWWFALFVAIIIGAIWAVIGYILSKTDEKERDSRKFSLRYVSSDDT